MYNFIGIVGTNSEQSTNRKLLQFMQKHFKKDAKIELLEIGDLPMFNKPSDKKIPARATELATKIDQADGIIISTPEYDHAVPAVLVNVLHWLSYGVFPFVDQPVMITGASYGTLGSSRAQAQLRQILDSPELKARIMPSSDYLLAHSLQAFDQEGNLIHSDDLARLDELFDDFLTFVSITQQMHLNREDHKKKAARFNWDKLN